MTKVRSKVWAVALACGLSACLSVKGAFSETVAVSTNTFGILKIEASTTNTMIAVPWTWYSQDQRDALNIPVKKLVKAENLELGDMLYTPIDNDTYAAWMLETNVVVIAVTNGVEVIQTNAAWSAVQVVQVVQADDSGSGASSQSASPQTVNRAAGFGRMQFVGDDEDDEDEAYLNSRRIVRGNGLWLHRQKPLDDQGNIRPFWLHGQSVTTEVTTVVSAPTGTLTVCSNMIGNPYAADIVLNSLTFQGGINTGDRIKIHVADNDNHALVYVSGKGWREYTTKVVGGVKKSGYTFQTVIPAGTAFWYDRRGVGNLTIKWPLPSAAK